MVAAAGSWRPVEAALWGFPSARWRGDKPALAGVAARRAAARVEVDADADQELEATAALASLRLLQGRPTIALHLLERVAASWPTDKRLDIDRAAALLAADRELDIAADIAAMVDGMASVTASGPESAGPWLFNRALLLERLGLRSDAARGFRAAADTGDGWVEESLARARALEQANAEPWEPAGRDRLSKALDGGDATAVARLVDRWPLAASAWAEEELLGSLAAPEGGVSRRRAERLANALRRRGDTFLADSIRALDADPARLDRVHADYFLGRSCQRQGQLEKAQELFADAARDLSAAGSPFEQLVQLRWASCEYQTGEPVRAQARLRAALARAPMEHRDLRARLTWLAGLIQFTSGDPAAALADYQRALDIYTGARVEEGIATVEMLSAETWWWLGEWREAWRHRRRALALFNSVADAERRRTILDEAAEASVGDRFLSLAAMLQDRVVESARRASNGFALGVALSQRARVRSSMGDQEAALEDLAASHQALAALPPGAFHDHLEMHLLAIEGEVWRGASPARAIEKFEAASVQSRQRGRWMMVRTYTLERARCRLRLGDEISALADLRLATALGARERRKESSDRVRGALDQQAQPLYDELVQLELERGHVDAAFHYSELGRARRLADALDVVPISLRALRTSLPPQSAVIAYHDFGARLTAFVVRREGAEVVDLGSMELPAGGDAWRSLAAGGSGDWPRRLAEFHARLIAPLETRLAGVSSLVVVPHGRLFTVPFAALFDGRRGRYLVEDFRLQMAPSATVFAAAMVRSVALRAVPRQVVALAPQPPQRGLAARLQPLRRAVPEALAVAAAYPHAEVLQGDNATASALLARARHATVVHFAGHALASSTDPAFSFLLLAPEAGGTGALYADEIARHRWPSTEVVVLSACSTAPGAKRDSEGVQGLARAFLAAGVPSVVGTLWPIDDDVGEMVAVRFHREHAGGLDAVTALRAAQLSLLREKPDGPPSWAAFEVIGGAAESRAH